MVHRKMCPLSGSGNCDHSVIHVKTFRQRLSNDVFFLKSKLYFFFQVVVIIFFFVSSLLEFTARSKLKTVWSSQMLYQVRAWHIDLSKLNSSIFHFIQWRLLHKKDLTTLINKKSYYLTMKILNRLVVINAMVCHKRPPEKQLGRRPH